MRRVRAHSLLLAPHGFYIGTTALAILGLPFLDAARAQDADLHVGVFAPHRALRRPGIRSVQVQPDLAHTTIVDGVCVATPATTWALMGRETSERDLVRMGDAIVRIPRDDRGHRRPELQIASTEQLTAAVSAGRRGGADRLRAALPRLRVGSMSLLETDWRLNLEEAGMAEPHLDVEVRDARGILLGISDGAYPEFRLAIEIEGDHHRTSRRQWHRDIQKYSSYTAIGWESVRLTSQHIRHSPGSDVDLVRRALRRRGWVA